MFDHVVLRVADVGAAERFYSATLAELGILEDDRDQEFISFGGFSIAPATAARPATHGVHLGFCAQDAAAVDAFWQAGIDAGFGSDGPPGLRPQYAEDYYGAFLLDPDGNSIEAVHHGKLRTSGTIDHLWLRVEDVAAARAFYDAIAGPSGFERVADEPWLVRYRARTGGGSMTITTGPPITRGVHLAFPATEQQAVADFHQAALGVGGEDDGPPGARPHYGADYYAAFVTDPSGQSVELVTGGP